MMSRVLAAGLMSLTLAALPATGASDDPPGAQSKKSPREQFQALLDEHQEAEKTFVQVISKAKTRQERDRVFKETYPDPSKYAVKFLAIADLAAGDPIEVDALVWCVQLGSRSPGGLKASERLAARHAEDKRVGRVAPYLGLTYSPTLETSTLAYAYSPPPEKLLRAIAGSNRDRDARGNATLALGKFLNWRAEFVRGLKDDPKRSEQVKALMASIGQDRADVDRLLATDPRPSSRKPRRHLSAS